MTYNNLHYDLTDTKKAIYIQNLQSTQLEASVPHNIAFSYGLSNTIINQCAQ